MRKIFLTFILICSLFLVTSCSKKEVRVIRIYNCVDYIDEDVLDEFVTWFADRHDGEEIDYIYDTFETPESMYNTLRTGKTSYDLCCPSDYMIQKMIREDRVDKFDRSHLEIYNEYCSPYIMDLFNEQKVTVNGEEVCWSDYAACYMWGTLGLIYNPEMLAEQLDLDDYDVTSWNDLNRPEFKNMVSLKDSVRDSYCVGAVLAYQDELKALDNTDPAYNALITDVINRADDASIELVSKELRNLKNNIYGLEVDSGKGDIVTGKIAMNLAWSGDAVYSIDLAEEEDIELRYNVPQEGGNVWFDGWIMPKGADKELAEEFVNFLSQPEIAAKNMEYIGYTSSIVGEDIFTLIDEWYGRAGNELYVEECEEALANATTEKEKEEAQEALDEAIDYRDNVAEYETFDLSYFFGDSVDDATIEIDTSYIDRQFTTQYPDEETLNRCGVFSDFDFKEVGRNEKVLEMWINVKANKASLALIISLGAFVLLVVGFYLYTKRSYFARKRRLNNKK